MESLELSNSILLTIISINMTIIGLTSLAEKKTVIGIDYGKYLINEYKLFRIVPLYYILIVFALINILALFALFFTDDRFRITIFVCLTVSLSFAIYYFFGYILRENRHVKNQLYENEFIGLYYKDDTPPGAECDRLAGMNNGFRTSKRVSSDVVTYFNKFNNDTQKAFKESFGPTSFIYKRNAAITKKYLKLTGHEPYDYTGQDGLCHISWEFFQLFRWSDLQEKWIMEILVLFNDGYAARSPEMKLNNLLRVFFHINTFGKCENLFGYRTIDYIYKYIRDVFDAPVPPTEARRVKERKLFEYYCTYLFACNADHRSEQSFRLSQSLLGALTDSDREGHISCHERMEIILERSAKFDDKNVRALVLGVYNAYLDHAAGRNEQAAIDPPRARAIIVAARQKRGYGPIAEAEIYPEA